MIKLFILAAGEGKRLRPFTKDKPKCMVNLEYKPLIEWQLSVIEKLNLKDITVVGGYKFQSLKNLGTKLVYNPLFASTNMVSTLFCVEEKLEGNIIVSYGDIVYSKEILSSAINFNGDIGIVADLNWKTYWENRSDDPLSDAESFKVNENGHIIDIGNKEDKLENIQAQYIGLTKLSKKGVAILRETFKRCKSLGFANGKKIEQAYMTDLIQEMIFSGYKVQPIYIDNPWIEIDTIEDLNSEVTKNRLNSIIKNL